MQNREDLLAHYRHQRAELLAAIDGLSEAALTDPSLDNWSVKDHLAHLALWDGLRADEVTRVSAGHDSAWKMTSAQDADFNRIGYDVRRGLSLAQVRWELSVTHERLLAAIAAATPRGLDARLYGEAGLRTNHAADHATWIRRWRHERGL